MLIQDGFLPLLQDLFKGSSSIPGLPFRFNSKVGRFEVKRGSRRWILFLSLMIFITPPILLDLKGILWRRSTHLLLLSVELVICTTTVSQMILILCLKAPSLTKFYNGVLQLEKYFTLRGLSLSNSRFSLLSAKSMLLINKMSPWVLGLSSGLIPCGPHNFMAPFKPSCTKATVSSGADELSLSDGGIIYFLLDTGIHWLIWKTILWVGFGYHIKFLIGCHCQQKAVKLFYRSTTSTTFDPIIYPQIQLLSSLFNQTFSISLFATFVAVQLFQTSIMYLLLRSLFSSEESVPLSFTLWNVAMLGEEFVITLFEGGLAGKVYSTSGKTLKKAMHNNWGTSTVREVGASKKFIRSTLKSYAPVKVNFGMSNFIESETPLKFLAFSVARLLELLLLD